MDKETFRRVGHELVDWVAEYLDTVDARPVVPRIDPGDILSRLADHAPETPESMNRIMDDFKHVIMPGISHWQHPGWFGYFPANSSPPSILAELLIAGVGAQCMIWQTSPAAAELETVVLDWLRKMLGLPENMTGVIQDGASAATLCALLTAREVATGFKSNLTGITMPLTVYTSVESHSSVEKGAKIAGFGKDHIRLIPTDPEFAMDPVELERAIVRDRKAGMTPACVVATIGTTSSTAVDPIDRIGRICRQYNVRLHVDAAYAGTAAVVPELRHFFKGLEYAHSFVFNPHKWMLTNFDCSAYFVTEPDLLTRTFEIHPEYLKTGLESQVTNYRDWGIPLGRRFRALKLWFVIRSYGVAGIRRMVTEHVHFANTFKRWVADHPSFELMAPVHFSLVCFRFNDGRPESTLNEFNEALLENINEPGDVFLTHTVLGGKYTLRMAIGTWKTEETHVRQAWERIVNCAEASA
ncbi:MAG: aminotransferase class V-fold PLP-dependent enzyme [Desulfobacteraceae bacterium]|nr:aminotransferase class V-fold PLP-dependent enzyme [Desulfobacteraceae bacterium]